MQHLFVTHAELISPRWKQCFPDAKILQSENHLPESLIDTLVWILIDESVALNQISTCVGRGARVIALSKSENSLQAKSVVEFGASGYLHYLAAVPVLQQASQVVQMGGLWLGVDLVRQLIVATANLLKPQQSSSCLHSLTQRERAVAQAVAAGKTNKEVARELAITERTVKAHLGAIFEKLHVRDRLQLVLIMAAK